MRKHFGLALICTALPGALACTAILGSFDVSPTGATADAGTDADVTPTDAATDATPSDAGPDAALPLLKCAINGVPKELDSAAAGTFDPSPNVLRAFKSGNNVRVIARKDGQLGFSVYSFDANQNGAPVSIASVATDGFPVLDVRSVAGGLGVLAARFDPSPSLAKAELVVFKIKDTDAIVPGTIFEAVPVSVPSAIANFPPNMKGTFVPLGVGDDIFWAISARYTGAPESMEVRIGRRKNGLGDNFDHLIAKQDVDAGVDEASMRVRAALPVAGKVFVFNDKGPEGTSGAGGGYWIVPEDPAQVPSPPQPSIVLTQLQKSGGLPLVAFAGDSQPLGARFAAAEVDFAASTAKLRAGFLPSNDWLPSINVNKIPSVFQFTSFYDAPIGGDARFFGADFVALGAPIAGDGLNFVWVDTVSGSPRGVQIGDNNKLLKGRTIKGATFAFNSATATIAQLTLVWAEEPNGSLGTFAKLFAATLTCAK